MVRHNNVVPNQHFRKKWQDKVGGRRPGHCCWRRFSQLLLLSRRRV